MKPWGLLSAGYYLNCSIAHPIPKPTSMDEGAGTGTLEDGSTIFCCDCALEVVKITSPFLSAHLGKTPQWVSCFCREPQGLCSRVSRNFPLQITTSLLCYLTPCWWGWGSSVRSSGGMYRSGVTLMQSLCFWGPCHSWLSFLGCSILKSVACDPVKSLPSLLLFSNFVVWGRSISGPSFLHP